MRAISATCALYGATTRTSGTSSRRSRPSRSIQRRPTSASIAAATQAASSRERLPATGMRQRHEADPRPPHRLTVAHELARVRRVRLQPPLIERVGDVGVHIRVQPVRRPEQQPAILGDGPRLADEVLQRGRAGAFRVDALRHLRQLVRIAQQDERRRRRR